MLVGGLAVVISFLVSLGGAWWTLRNAPRLGLVQTPNARSSHARPTPTGGGIGIALGLLVAGAYASVLQPWPSVLILGAGLGMAAVGLADDIRPVRWYLRLGAQFVLFGAVAFTLLPPLAAAPALIAGVLFINLFNFMDGIDGIAASEAGFIFLAAGVLMMADTPEAWWLVALGASALAFLPLNFPPARIFMGDVGSTSLGLTIAAMAVLTRDTIGIWCWLILAAVFIADGLVTLTRRILQGERVFEAHRRHAYQILSRKFGSHRMVTLAVVAINVIWLLPLAWLARSDGAFAPWATLIAYVPLVVGTVLVGAGRKQPGEI